MTPGAGRLHRARIAVISCSLLPEENELWQAAAGEVGELRLIGAKALPSEPRVEPSTALRELMSGKGLVWRHLVGLQAELRRFQPDLVQVNGELWSVTTQEVLRHRHNVVVHGAENLWQHGGALERRIRDRLVDRAVRRVVGYASWNETGAEHVRALRRRLDGTDLPTAVLPTIVPPEPYRSASWVARDDDPSPLKILLVGRAVPEKGFALVIQAAHLLGRPVQVTLCGEGPEEDSLIRSAKAYGVPLRARGWVDSRVLAELMATSHMLVQPSRDVADWSEQFGRTVAEAMAVGLPVVVSDAGALPELVGHQRTAIFRQDDPDDLADRLRAITGASGGLAALAAPQRSRADAYLPARAATEILTLWNSLL